MNNQSQDFSPKKIKVKDWYIPGVLLGIIMLVFLSFLFSESRFEISAGILACLAFAVSVALADKFDEISITKVIDLKRKVQIEGAKAEKAERRNDELLSKLIDISVRVNQSQNTVLQNGITSDALTNLISVVKNDGKEQKEEDNDLAAATPSLGEKSTQSTQNEQTANTPASTAENFRAVRNQNRVIEKDSLKQFAVRRGILDDNIMKDARFNEAFQHIDPIMERPIFFDAYIQSPSEEIFIDIRSSNSLSPMFADRLYIMLSKIMHYRAAKGNEAYLIVLISKIEGDPDRRGFDSQRFVEWFRPAIKSGILKIEYVHYKKEDIDKLIKDEESFRQLGS